ncbi:DNA cytosine methyltransferase [Vibrio cholerae]|uniref:DNA cytosine methyltransferase n=1 Tax=Vibrio TaxID=662 RepID=UPI000F3C1A12|nr:MULTISPECIES: DNA cytosine methyltransferase [Vibrio]GHW87632.1 Cytosine-specific methyltransferase HgiDII; restriction system [Vibrio metoecus]EGR4070789.1 DNA cytosine methyltransferase [Vibrio cholerae]EGR5062906.1 DNA cytosine methyltransferase [Vibrio cholerae]EJL6556700.1 DNA cytosine methyltransferase [Vibrio cholerae]EJL6738998.1 DNA cytosine methyltransferase [Vibrio cholerae]
MKEKQYFEAAKNALKNWKPQNEINGREEIQVIDLFCGAGGMSLGFAALGKVEGTFKVIGGGDINKVSLDSYSHNFGVPGIQVDVNKLASSKEELENFLSKLDGYDPQKKTILIGCAPCQGFSAHRKKNWDNPDDRNGLVEAFAEVCSMLQPDCVIMENVPELLSSKYWHHFENFRKKLEHNGYVVKQSIHNAASYGVPQERFRALVMAMKTDFSMPIENLSREEFRTVRDAIADLPAVAAGKICEKDPMHKSASHRKSTIDVIKAVPKNGGSRPHGVGPKCLQDFKGYADVYGRLYWDKPAITITHYARNPASGRFVHPEQDRGLTAREAARLQSFPDGYQFKGGFDDIFRQIGEAVPPLLSLGVACSVLANYRNESSKGQDNVINMPVNNSFAGVIAGIKNGSR